MKCSTFERELLEHLQGLDLGVEARLHAESCGHCRLLWQNQLALLNRIAEEKQVQVPPFLSTRVMAGIKKPEIRIHAISVWKQVLQVAAVLLALVGGYSASVIMEERSANEDFSVVLSDYFLMEPGSSIEEGWLYSEAYENE
jgi:hypothetical protein